MSIRKTVTYIDNRGQEHDVRYMETSHILNVLNLIKNQMQTINFFSIENVVVNRLIKEDTQECLLKSLRADAKLLTGELNRRMKKIGCKGLKETA